MPKRINVKFPQCWHERGEYEFICKGYVPDVEVHIETEGIYRLFFFDSVRIRQELESATAQGRAYVAEPGMVLVPEVSRAAIEDAIKGLAAESFFVHLKRVQ